MERKPEEIQNRLSALEESGRPGLLRPLAEDVGPLRTALDTLDTSVSQLGDHKKLKERLDRAATPEMVGAVQDLIVSYKKRLLECETKFVKYKAQTDGLAGSITRHQLDKTDTSAAREIISHHLDHISTTPTPTGTTTITRQAAVPDMAAALQVREEVLQTLRYQLRSAGIQHRVDLANCQATLEARLEKKVGHLGATIRSLTRTGPTTTAPATATLPTTSSAADHRESSRAPLLG